jgi:hypothetical protein
MGWAIYFSESGSCSDPWMASMDQAEGLNGESYATEDAARKAKCVAINGEMLDASVFSLRLLNQT